MYKDGDILVPGEEIKWDGKIVGEVYKEGERVYPKFVSTVRVSEDTLRVIPLSKVYIPKRNDFVIGIVKELAPIGWVIDINSPYKGILPVRELKKPILNPLEVDLTKVLRPGQVIFAKVISVSKLGTATLSMKDEKAKRLRGVLIKINPAKVARIIGKGGSLVKMFKEYLKVTVTVGQNGYVVVYGKDLETVEFVIDLIKYVEKYSHRKGLTDYVKEQLEKYANEKGIVVTEAEKQELDSEGEELEEENSQSASE